MNSTASVFGRYRDGDIEERLYLYLEHRDFRDEFIDMEMNLSDLYQKKEPFKNNSVVIRKPFQMPSTLFKIASLLFGGGSMVYFVLFLLFGTAVSMDLNLAPGGELLLDFFLSTLFFTQHSIMVRPGFKKRLLTMVPDHLIPRFFALVSGLTLMVVVFFWQGTGAPFILLPAWLSFVTGLFFVMAFAGFYWGVSSLPFFDPFCLFDVKDLEKKKPVLQPRGPYQFVRHPLYFFTLILIWSSTEFTLDRLMFNLLWSGWIVLGSWLEEKDLVDLFGEDYLAYQKRTPMLFPNKLPSLNR